MNGQTKAKRNLKRARDAATQAGEVPKLVEEAEHLRRELSAAHQRAEHLNLEIANLKLSMRQYANQQAQHQKDVEDLKQVSSQRQALLLTRCDELEKAAESFSTSAVRRKLQELKDENAKLHAEGLPALRKAEARVKQLESHLRVPGNLGLPVEV